MSRYLLIVLVLLLASCAEDPPVERFYIYGYTCGDSMDNRISIEHTFHGPEQIQIGGFQNDSRVRFLMIHGDIWSIKFDSITFSEADSMARKINEIYLRTPAVTYSKARDAKQWLWRDSIWNDKIVISKMHRNNPDSLYSLYFEKPVSSNWVTR